MALCVQCKFPILGMYYFIYCMKRKYLAVAVAAVLISCIPARAQAIPPDSLDFIDFMDALTLDANTSIASAGFHLDLTSAQLWLRGQLFMHRPGNSNTYVGENAGAASATGFGNTTLGKGAGQTLSTGAVNTFIGYLAGNVASSSNHNTFVGANAGQFNTSGQANVFIGRQAGLFNTTGSNNTFVGGFNPGANNTIGGNNVFVGDRAGQANTTGSNNTFLGLRAGFSNTTATDNTFVGLFAGLTNSTGQWSTYLGRDTGRFALGSFNTFLGAGADATLTSATGSIAIGSMAKVTASNQAVIGSSAVSGSINDVYIGQGVTAPSAGGVTLNATGGSGIDNAGAPLRIAGGKGTGSAQGGAISLQTAPAGGSGSALNALVDRLTITSAGNVGIGTATPQAKLDINADAFILETPKTPISASDSCVTGTHAWDADYLYVCVATDTWKRAALSAW